MKTLLRARTYAPKKNDSIRAPFARRSGTAQGAIGPEQRRDGRTVQPGQWPSVAPVFVRGSEQSSRHGNAHAVLCDGSARAGCGDVRSDLESNAQGRRDDRAGQRVTAGGALTAAIPTPSTDQFDLIPSSWRTGRHAKPTLNVSPDLFAIAGTRAAENWLATRPTARPNRWCRAAFDNLVAGLGRIPSYADCLAAFERSFKRRIEAAARADRQAAEVRA